MKIKIALLLLLGGLLGPTGLIPAETPPNASLVSVPKNLVTGRKIESLGLDVLAEWQGKFFVLAGPEDLERLEAGQIIYRPETAAGPAYPASPARGGINGAYHTYLELQTDLFALERSHPDIAKIFDIGDSHEKRHIYALKISDNVAVEEEEAEILFTRLPSCPGVDLGRGPLPPGKIPGRELRDRSRGQAPRRPERDLDRSARQPRRPGVLDPRLPLLAEKPPGQRPRQFRRGP